ncbi:T9SS type B sorting domain-containing protein [Winogradskyella maritima]|uniref:T9SS type B sorting domain-containing protein n=1 Tax=Winogradskyella maritima TaxID=1517766 RepID=A0ABV8AEC3_9FLAO|nr:T9SS type B sorting domain-containing protein [Winogradskyella maritima]
MSSTLFSQTPLHSGVAVSDFGISNSIGSANTSKNLATDREGNIYVVYRTDSAIRLARSINGGESFLPSTLVRNFGSSDPEITVGDTGIIYVAWVENGVALLARSLDQGQTFGPPVTVGPMNSITLHMSTYGPNVYILGQNGSILYSNASEGVGSYNSVSSGVSMAYSDVLTDANGKIYLPMDDPNLLLFSSEDEGSSLTQTNLNPAEDVFFSSYALSDGPCGTYIFVAGSLFDPSTTLGFRMDVVTGDLSPINFGLSEVEAEGRTLYADNTGTLIDGYKDINGNLVMAISSDQGNTFNTPIVIANGASHNLARDNTENTLLVVYEQNGRIFLNVYDDILKNINIIEPDIPLTLCDNSEFSVNFTLDGSFSAMSVFTVVLSDEFGNFENSIELGSTVTDSNGTIMFTLPDNLVPSPDYKIRIESFVNCLQSEPLTIDLGQGSLNGPTEACVGNSIQYLASGNTTDAMPWSSSDTTVASINDTGLLTAVMAGTTTIEYVSDSGCTLTLDLEIFDNPVVTDVVTLQQCDTDTDGFSAFNLKEVNPELSVDHENFTISFHESLEDAQSGMAIILNDEVYINEVQTIDKVWARVENGQGCFDTAEVNLIVSATQIPDDFIRVYYSCDDLLDQQDGIATFDFSDIQNTLDGLFPPSEQLNISYYRNEADALSENDPILDTSNYRNEGYPNSQDIYVRVDSALNNDCLGLGHHITLVVDEVPLVTGPIIIEQCDAGNDGLESFDTSGIEDELSLGQSQNITFTYVDEMGNVYPSPLPNPLVSNTPILNIFATMTYDNPLNPNSGCSVETTVSLVISNSVIANPVEDFKVCDEDGDGIHAFDISNLNAIILNGQTEILLNFYDGDGALMPNPLPNPFLTSTQTITARVENPLNPLCFDETTITFIVAEIPIANEIQDEFVCDDSSNDGEYVFDLSSFNDQVFGSQSDQIFEVLYFETESDAIDNINSLSTDYLVDSEETPVFARLQNILNNDCFVISEFKLGVNFSPFAYQPETLRTCDDDINDGFTQIDLSIQNDAILNDQDFPDLEIKYFTSLDDAEDDINQIPTVFTNSENPQLIFARIENTTAPECFSTTQFMVEVYEQPVLLMDDLWSICEDSSIEVYADSGYDNYSWSTGETTQSITVENPGQYSVRVWNDYNDFICEAEKTITVEESQIASIVDIDINDWTQTENSISINVTGSGDYEYSIDGILFQDSNVFEQLLAGEYMVYVRDKKGCGVATETVYLLYYPRYFTPNGDGNHDTWQIINGFVEPTNVIRIFDRYGKLLKQLSPIGNGWDGTYNGNPMPTSDYWFVVNREDGKQYSGHFTLKR